MNNNNNNWLFNELEDRGFIYQKSDENMSEILENKKMTVYVWTDPTADSLHIWHLVPMLMLSHFKKHGHNPILLVWWATWMIWDPSFKNTERNLLTEEKVNSNLVWIINQVDRILNNDKNNSVEVVNNYDWFKNINILDFLRDTWKYFSVNSMLARDSVKSRIEDPKQWISFTEFAYTLLQSYDFLYLNKEKWCNIQIWWSDQWWNIVSWIDLVRKTTGATVHWLTCPLITKSDWTKFWKSEWWNIWLDPTKTSPYEFYQFWINVADEEAYKFIKLYTFISLNKIDEIIKESKRNPEKRIVQKILASEITSMIHGKELCANVVNATDVIYSKSNRNNISKGWLDVLSKELDNIELKIKDFNMEWLFSSMIDLWLYKSKSELRRLLDSDSLTINWINLKDVDFTLFKKWKFLLKKWKKTHYIISLI